MYYHPLFTKMNAIGCGLLEIEKRVVTKRINYEHKNQLEYYGSGDPDKSCEQFRKWYRFKEETVKKLSKWLEPEIGPKRLTNNAISTEQHMCCALRFYATGTFQTEVGDGEGISQTSMHRIINLVTNALSDHADDIIKFSVYPQVLETVSNGFYGFKGSESMS